MCLPQSCRRPLPRCQVDTHSLTHSLTVLSKGGVHARKLHVMSIDIVPLFSVQTGHEQNSGKAAIIPIPRCTSISKNLVASSRLRALAPMCMAFCGEKSQQVRSWMKLARIQGFMRHQPGCKSLHSSGVQGLAWECHLGVSSMSIQRFVSDRNHLPNCVRFHAILEPVGRSPQLLPAFRAHTTRQSNAIKLRMLFQCHYTGATCRHKGMCAYLYFALYIYIYIYI